MTVPPPPAVPGELIEKAAAALAQVQTPNCSPDWPNACEMCDCFRDVAGQSMAGYEREHAAAVIAAVYGGIVEAARREALDVAHLDRQREWSGRTFGPGRRTGGVTAHIAKELDEIRAAPDDLGEWVDVVILALDGAWRTGASSAEIIAAVKAKQTRNETRTWPDWRTMSEDEAIEHDRSSDGTAPRDGLSATHADPTPVPRTPGTPEAQNAVQPLAARPTMRPYWHGSQPGGVA